MDALLSGLREHGLDMPDEVIEADVLSRFAWQARYPGLEEAVAKEEYCGAIHMAEAVLAWASAHCIADAP